MKKVVKKGRIRAVTLVTPTSICEGTMNLCSSSTYAWKKKKRNRGSECSERTRPFLTTKWDPGLIGSLVRVVRRDHWGIVEQEGQCVILGQWRSSNNRLFPESVCLSKKLNRKFAHLKDFKRKQDWQKRLLITHLLAIVGVTCPTAKMYTFHLLIK